MMTNRTAPGTHKYQRILIPTVLMLSLALGLFGLSTPASASTIIIDDSKYVSDNYNFVETTRNVQRPLTHIGFSNAKDLRAPFTIVGFGEIIAPPGVYAGNYPVVLKYYGTIVGTGTESFQVFPNSPESSYVVLTVDDFDGAAISGGYQVVVMDGRAPLNFKIGGKAYFTTGAIEPPPAYAAFGYAADSYPSDNTWRYGDAYTLNTIFEYKTSIEYIEEGSYPINIDNISQTRIIDGNSYPAYSVLTGKSGGEYWNSTGTTPLNVKISANERPYTLTIYSEILDRWYTYTLYEDSGPGPGLSPCTIYVYDADTRLPLAGDWEYYIVVEGSDAVSGSASGASVIVNLPETSILQPHLLRVTKEGYVQVPEILAINVPKGGREIPVYLRSTTAPPEEGNVWLGFTCTDADTGSPVSSALVNLDGSAQYTGASGYVRFQVPMNSTHEWVASSSSHWPMGGTVTVETADLNVPVELVRKTSDLPRPPLPDLPNFPVIHPVLDPAGFRAQILNVPILGDLASPLLDTMDAIAVGLDDIVHPILDFVTAPADSMLQALEGVGDQLTVSVTTYTNIAGVVLGSVGKLLAVFPDLVIGLVTYNLVLDLVYLLLRGGL